MNDRKLIRREDWYRDDNRGRTSFHRVACDNNFERINLCVQVNSHMSWGTSKTRWRGGKGMVMPK